MNRTLQIALNLVTGVVAFLFFVVMLFPLDTVVSHYLANLESWTGGRYRVMISEMDTSLLFDSEFRGLRVEQKGEEGFVEVLNIPRVRVGLSLLALFSKSARLKFESDFKKGGVEGTVVLSPEALVLDLDFDGMDIAELGFLKASLKGAPFAFDVNGLVEGDFSLYKPQGLSVLSLDTQFNLRVADFKIRDIKAKVAGQSFYLAEVMLAPQESFAQFEGSLEGGRLTLANVSIPGNDLELQLSGRLGFGNKLEVVRSSLNGRFAFSEMLMEKIPFLAVLGEQRKADGYYPLRISGPSSKPQVRIGSLNLAEMLGW